MRTYLTRIPTCNRMRGDVVIITHLMKESLRWRRKKEDKNSISQSHMLRDVM